MRRLVHAVVVAAVVGCVGLGAGTIGPAAAADPLPTTLTVEPLVLRVGGPALVEVHVASVSAVLTTANGGPIASQTVTFTTGAGAPLCITFTQADGRATCPLTLPHTLQAIFSGGVLAQYAGTTAYAPSTGVGGLLKLG